MTVCQNRQFGPTLQANNNVYQCTNVNGQKQWVYQSSSKCDDGKGTCSETGQCIAAERCDHKTFEARCEGNLAISCVQDKVKIMDCNASSTPMSCYTASNIAGCSRVELHCDYEGQILSNACFESKKTNQGHARSYVCSLDESGGLVPVFNGIGRCEKGCNADKTACAE